ncbi:MAG: HPr(Ser) kinase/phosphatase [Gemmatimonadaceae bacterium]|nr:HPr(Ser) kinase/phosphatase [Gemmatimonadaceae bacterium]
MPTLTVAQLYERLKDPLQLELLGNAEGLAREVTSADASGPGLVLAGFTGRFVAQRVQVFGETEIRFLTSLEPAERARNLELYFAYPIPVVMITKGQSLPEGMERIATERGVAILRSPLKTQEFYRRITPWLADAFAPTLNLHGSLADVFGVGLLFTGKSGVGKSECVLDLVERGHRLVADDLVLVKRRGSDILLGRGHELARHHMEIRGVGLIDVQAIFGIRSVRQQKRIEVVVELVKWEEAQDVDRTGLDMKTTNILDVQIPHIMVPLNPGKNITVIAEVIAMNHLLRFSGHDTAHAFNEGLKRKLRPSTAHVQHYLQEDDE